MLLTIPIDIFVNIGAGFALALAGRDAPADASAGPLAVTPWRVALAFHALVLTPICAWFLLALPDWSWAYAIQPSPGLAALVIAAYLAGGLGAFGLARRWVAAGRGGLVLGAVAANLALSGLALALTFPRFIAVGDAAAFAQGHATPLWQHQGLLVALPCLGASGAGGFLLALGALVRLRRP